MATGQGTQHQSAGCDGTEEQGLTHARVIPRHDAAKQHDGVPEGAPSLVSAEEQN